MIVLKNSKSLCMAPVYVGVEDDVGNILLNFCVCILSKRETHLYNACLPLLRCETRVMYVGLIFNCKGDVLVVAHLSLTWEIYY
jgi:hypothetical protein